MSEPTSIIQVLEARMRAYSEAFRAGLHASIARSYGMTVEELMALNNRELARLLDSPPSWSSTP
jgi:hypothetical protein